MNCTIFQSIYDKEPHHITVDKALARIKEGRSASKVQEVREALDKAKADALKKQLPAVVFSGTFAARGDKNLQAHSGFLVLDFDKLAEPAEKMAEMASFPSTYAAWISPSGQGVKALIRIADGNKHRQHFDALRETFPDADASGANEERLCFESYDPHIYINESAEPYKAVLTLTKQAETFDATHGDEREVFKRLLKWMANKGKYFVDGERNKFIFRLAGGCCRFGIDAMAAAALITAEFPTSNDFTQREIVTTVKSAYKRNRDAEGSCRFEGERMVDRKTRREVDFDSVPDFDPEAPPKDVVYADTIEGSIMDYYDMGNEAVKGINISDIDELFKLRPGEGTVLTGIGNYGKSAFYKWFYLMRCLLYGERFVAFAPEDNPPRDYYVDYIEMLLGCDCSPMNPNRPSRDVYKRAKDWVGKHIFLLVPEDAEPTPSYIKERFFEVIVKEKVSGICIDPWNQLFHDTKARSDQYLSAMLGDLTRFARKNDVSLLIVAHPKSLTKPPGEKNYPCPDFQDIADGPMWNNKMDNILVYHRPLGQTEPNNPLCELHSKKIKKKFVGRKGMNPFRYVIHKRRFEFGSTDPLEDALKLRSISFEDKAPVAIPQSAPPIDLGRLKNFFDE